MTKVILIDDEPLARAVIREYLQNLQDFEIVAECGDGFEAMKAIARHQPDLLFLDIQMPKISGFELLELLEEPPGVIFATAFDEYAIRAFEANAVDYLLKPFSRERFDKAVEKFRQQAAAGKTQVKTLLEKMESDAGPQHRIIVKINNVIKIIPLQDVQYLEAADDYVKVHTADGHFLKNKTMQFFEQSLPPQQFVRVHRSYILNISYITRLDPYEKEGYVAVLKTGAHIPVSKTGYPRLKTVLGL
ncbi:LytR/AlgR family response regulator transcription factor [Compostibacter hankyongensis]